MNDLGPMEFSADDPYYAAVCYALSHGASKLNEYPGCWERQVDENWFVAFNGHDKPTLTNGGNGRGDDAPPYPVDPFAIAVEWYGWPAGILTPSGGYMASGAAANVETFVAALEANKGPQS